MLQKLLLLFTLSFFSGCGVVDFYTEDVPSSAYDAIPPYNAQKCGTPYSSSAFRAVLNQCYLQHPDTQKVVDYGAFEGYHSPFFYLCDGLLYFVVSKTRRAPKVRSELRQGPDSWSVEDRHACHAALRCFKPKPGIDAYTWLQIHGDQATYNYPLIRLMWVRSYHGVQDHLWAIILVTSPDEERRYEWVDLGKRTKAIFNVDVEVEDGWLSVFIDDRKVVSRDVRYWESVRNYFKAGIYLNRHDDSGKAAVAFKYISF